VRAFRSSITILLLPIHGPITKMLLLEEAQCTL
jgi:hypothetical protein